MGIRQAGRWAVDLLYGCLVGLLHGLSGVLPGWLSICPDGLFVGSWAGWLARRLAAWMSEY